MARFVRRADLASLATRGPLTPDHVIRTKRLPMVGRDVDGYADDYRTLLRRAPGAGPDRADRCSTRRRASCSTPSWACSRPAATAKDARIAADIYGHTMPVIERAEDHLGGYRALPAGRPLRRGVLGARAGQAPPRRAADRRSPGEVALVTGAASGIGRAWRPSCSAGAACVAGIDRAAEVHDLFPGPDWVGVTST